MGALTRRALRWLGQAALYVVVVAALWEAAVKLFGVPEYLLPPPTQILDRVREHLPLLWSNSLVTLYEVLIGFGVALVGGVLLGVMVASVRAIERAATPVILFFQVVPKSALAPLLIVWAGVGVASKVALVFLMCFFPILIETVAGMRSVNEEVTMLARSTRARRRDVFLKIQFPHSLPHLFSGIKVSITLAVVGAVVAEFIAASKGMGYLLLVAFGRLDTPLVIAGLLAVTALALLLYALVLAGERFLIPWHVSQRGGGRL